MARTYHLRPSDLRDMTLAEIDLFIADYQRLVAQSEEANRG